MNHTASPTAVHASAFRSFGKLRGAAPTLVFSHSLGADSSMWAPQLDALAEDYHLVTIDTRGHGASHVPEGPYVVSQLASDILNVLDQLGIERFHFCGISLGGMIGQWLGCFAGPRVERLVLCNTAARIGDEARWAERMNQVKALGMEQVARQVVPRWLAPSFPSREPDLFATLLTTFRETDPAGYIACCQALQEADLRSDVNRIRVPTLIIGGALDTSTSAEEAHFLQSQIDNAELTVFTDAAHLSNLDLPEAFTDRIRRFLARS